MKLSMLAATAALALIVPPVLSAPWAPAQRPSPGDAAPEIDGSVWFNVIGRSPTLADLEGHAVLLEFWATY